MNSEDIIQYWKDEQFREESAVDFATMPQNPAGDIELPDDVLGISTRGGEAEPSGTSWPCVLATVVATSTGFSCTPSCDQTFLIGTCGAFSYGCCAH